MGRKAPSTLRLDSFNNDSTADPDSIELSFNGSSHEYFPSMSTLITTGSENSLRRPHSSKSTVYISREFTIHEEFTDPGKPPPIPARFLEQSNGSDDSKESSREEKSSEESDKSSETEKEGVSDKASDSSQINRHPSVSVKDFGIGAAL